MQGKRGELTPRQLATLKGRKWTIAERQVEVARMYALGFSQAEISEKVGVIQQQVSKDLAVIKARWLEMACVTFAEHRGKQLDSIDWIERECQEAWETSKQDARATKVTVERVLQPVEEVNGSIRGNSKQKGRGSGSKNGKQDMKVGVKVPNMKLIPVRKYIERTVKGQTGNVAFIQQIAWCIETRLKIFGVLEEKKGDVNILNLNWEQLESKVRQQAPDAVEERLRLEALKVVRE